MSSRVLIPKATEETLRGRGRWWLRKAGDRDVVVVSCPGCGLDGTLDHDVSADGRVEPSLDCPEPHCSFHAFVRLEDWDRGPLPRVS